MVDQDDNGEEPAGPVAELPRRVKASSLLWFISSRPYVPMADIRRRFDLYTDTGSLLWDDEGPIHIGLPRQAAETLLDLKRKQKVGMEFNLEHAMRIAVGVYPVRIRLAPPPPARPSPVASRSAPPPPEPPLVDAVVEPLESAEPTDAPAIVEAAAPTSRARSRRRRRSR